MCTAVANINSTTFRTILNQFDPTSRCPCAYHFANKRSEIESRGEIPATIVPKVFPGNVTVCYNHVKYDDKIFKFKVFQSGKIHFAGGLLPKDVNEAFETVASSFRATLKSDPVIVMINAVYHLGKPINLVKLQEVFPSFSSVPHYYDSDFHSAFRVVLFDTPDFLCACENQQCHKYLFVEKKYNKLIKCRRVTILVQPTGAIQLMAAPRQRMLDKSVSFLDKMNVELND